MTCPMCKIKLQFLGIWTPSFICELNFFKFSKERNKYILYLWKVKWVQKSLSTSFIWLVNKVIYQKCSQFALSIWSSSPISIRKIFVWRNSANTIPLENIIMIITFIFFSALCLVCSIKCGLIGKIYEKLHFTQIAHFS